MGLDDLLDDGVRVPVEMAVEKLGRRENPVVEETPKAVARRLSVRGWGFLLPSRIAATVRLSRPEQWQTSSTVKFSSAISRRRFWPGSFAMRVTRSQATRGWKRPKGPCPS